MYRQIATTFLFIVTFAPLAALADSPPARHRIALVIANAQYSSPNLGALPGTRLDAAVMKATLEDLGFQVKVAKDLDRAHLQDEIALFVRQLRSEGNDAVGFLYYAGHGAADGPRGHNFLVPVDADIRDVADLQTSAVPVDEILDSIENAHAQAAVVVLDACRNQVVALHRGPRGLAPVDMRSDILLAFSTAPNETADDNGLYAQALSHELGRGGADLSSIFAHVQVDVADTTQRKQRPVFTDGLLRPVTLSLAKEPMRESDTAKPKFVLNAAPRAQSTVNPNDIVLDFNSVSTLLNADHAAAAAPFLKNSENPISITDVEPKGSSVVFVNNLGLYDGHGVQPTVSENFLTQVATGNIVASFSLRFARPVQHVSFMLPAVYAYTETGITLPAWKAVALSASGEELTSTQQKILRQFANFPAQTYTLNAVGFDGISAVKFTSDPNLNGKPFAAFSAMLIEQLSFGSK